LPFVSVTYVNDGKVSEFKVPMVKCKLEWFKKLGGYLGEKTISRRLCADQDKLKDFWILKNSFGNDKERVSMAFKIEMCNSNGCESREKTQKLLDKIFFTQMILVGQAKLNSVDGAFPYPVSYIDYFMQQYQLNVDKYRDNNNFVRLNEIYAKDARLNFLESPNKYSFLDIYALPVWESNSIKYQANVSTDGVSFKEED
jgi:hypothetical protein